METGPVVNLTAPPDAPRHASVSSSSAEFRSKCLINRFIDFVDNNPSEFADAYFDIASIRIYQ